MRDIYDTKAEELLPCSKQCQSYDPTPGHIADCPASFRPAVAGALRAEAKRVTAIDIKIIENSLTRNLPEIIQKIRIARAQELS